MFGIGGVDHQHVGARSVFAGSDVELVLVDLAAVKEFLAAGDFNWRSASLQVLKVHFALGPTLEDGDEQPAIVIVGELYTGNVLCGTAFAEDKRILGGVGPHGVIENLDVID